MDDNINSNNNEINNNNGHEDNVIKAQDFQESTIIPQPDGFMTYQQPVEQPIQVELQNSVNEVAYYPPNSQKPPKKKGKAKRIFKGFVIVLCVMVISVGSIAGYKAIKENAFDIPFLNTKSDSSSISDTNNSKTDDSKTDKDKPSLLQLAGKENALSVPKIVEKVSPSVVGISCKYPQGTATGTGIIMTADGYIITNGHVVQDATEITVVISNDGKLEENKAKLVGIDIKTDLAVIKVDKENLTPAEFGKSNELQVGELAIAIGNPLGFELSGSVTGGIISALNRELTIEDKQLNLIQTDAAINPGNSGGPLVNSYGQVIGITSAKISSSYAEGLGFAIPIDEAKPIIDDLIAFGYVKGRPTLGISGEEITDVIARYYNLPQGIIVRFIEPDSGASKANIKLGDVIIGIDDKPITTMAELNKIKETHKAGETVKLGIYRDGKNIDVDVTLNEATK